MKIQTLLITILLILCGAILTATQAQAQTTNSAPDSQTTRAAPNGEECAVCNKRLEKTLDALDKSERLSVAKDEQIKVRDERESVNVALLKKKDEIIAAQEKLLKLAQKKTGKCFGIGAGGFCLGIKF
jgi:predicted transglutaminase-like cysteine proteinase